MSVNQVTHPPRRYEAGGSVPAQYWFHFKDPVGHGVKDMLIQLALMSCDSGVTVTVEIYSGPAPGTYLSTPYATVTGTTSTAGIYNGYTDVSAAPGPLWAWVGILMKVTGAAGTGCTAQVTVDGKPF